ncbi:hypothetical protein AB0M47_40485 [Hamadaea sp. NPDC051192]|uniref:hypothetical protein n=1 Tax=Hamadaea sp. NPDC051192 TaxID=3154940 RepID=UPI00343E1904
MSSTVLPEPPVSIAESLDGGRERRGLDRPGRFDIAVTIVFLGAAIGMRMRILGDPAHAVIAANPDDHVFSNGFWPMPPTPSSTASRLFSDDELGVAVTAGPRR